MIIALAGRGIFEDLDCLHPLVRYGGGTGTRECTPDRQQKFRRIEGDRRLLYGAPKNPRS